MKKLLTFLLGIVLLLATISCDQLDNECLPYEGEIYDLGNPCSGIVIKVTNRDINSSWVVENNIKIDDVIGVRFNEAHISIDTSLINKKFYFDFRELSPEEGHLTICPALYSAPTRIVFITDLSYTKCKEVDR